MSTIKLLQLNVEWGLHWDRIIPFLEREQPEVLCLQELLDRDLEMLASRFGYDHAYLPLTKRVMKPGDPSTLAKWGVAILSPFPLQNKGSATYYAAGPELQMYRGETVESKRATINQGIAWATVEKGGERFVFGSTHFTHTPDGSPNANQDRDLPALFKVLDEPANGLGELVLCGDFNAPREPDNRIYRALAARFRDNIPSDVKTTMDLRFHRTRNDPAEGAHVATLIVDYIFSTPRYAVRDVRCEFGLSDHCGVVAEVGIG